MLIKYRFKTVCVVLAFTTSTFAQTLTIINSHINSIKFNASSTLSNFEGTTSAVKGYIKYDSSFTNNSTIDIQVYLDSLDTGIGLRNSHMRNKYLDTKAYPITRFKGKITSAVDSSSIISIVQAEGKLKIHGVEKNLKITGELSDFGKLVKLQTSFNVYLPDFNIEQPSFLFNSVDNHITVDCIIYFTENH